MKPQQMFPLVGLMLIAAVVGGGAAYYDTLLGAKRFLLGPVTRGDLLTFSMVWAFAWLASFLIRRQGGQSALSREGMPALALGLVASNIASRAVESLALTQAILVGGYLLTLWVAVTRLNVETAPAVDAKQG